jgi:hypothetical protein
MARCTSKHTIMTLDALFAISEIAIIVDHYPLIQRSLRQLLYIKTSILESTRFFSTTAQQNWAKHAQRHEGPAASGFGHYTQRCPFALYPHTPNIYMITPAHKVSYFPRLMRLLKTDRSQQATYFLTTFGTDQLHSVMVYPSANTTGMQGPIDKNAFCWQML